MKTLLRSVFISAASDNKDLFFRNYLNLVDSGLGFDIAEDVIIWEFIKDFVRAHNHIPDVTTIRTHFAHKQEDGILNRIAVLENLPAYTQGDFDVRLNAKADERRVREVSELLKDASVIVSSGLEIREGRDKKMLKGPIDAIHHILGQSHGIVSPVVGSRLSGEVTTDGVDFIKTYEKVEADPLAGIGQHTGLTQMDAALNGAKRYELWTHAAFTGHMKSTMLLNWAYNQAVYFLHDSLIFSLEMPYKQCRNILYAIHSSHEKFRYIRYCLGLQTDPFGTVGLPYEGIRDGDLPSWHKNAKRFLFEWVIPDFNGKRVEVDFHPDTGQPLMDSKSGKAFTFTRDGNGDPYPDPSNYGRIHIEVADPDKSDFSIADMRHKAELIYSKRPFSLLFVDHVSLMSPRKWVSNRTDRDNEIIRDLKKLAMSFNRGEGMAVVGLFQINRDGFRTALKMKEKTGTARYDLTNLAYANECLLYNTPIGTDKGLIPIGKMKAGCKVWSSSGWKEEVKEVFDQGVRRIWKVTNDRHACLEATDTHKVRILTEEGVQWAEVRNLKPGDFLVGSEYQFAETIPSIPEWNGRTKPDENLAWLIGAWDGDGTVRKYGVAFTGNRKETVLEKRLLNTLNEIHGRQAKHYHFLSRPGSFDMEAGDKHFKSWWDGIAAPRGEKVPEVILQSPGSLVIAYLQGLFDADGWINSQGVVGISSKHEEFMRQVQLLLTCLGIDSCLNKKMVILKKTGKQYPCWTVHVRGPWSRVGFRDLIGFTEPWKQEQLERFTCRTSRLDRSGNVLPLLNLVSGLANEFLPVKHQFDKIFRRNQKKGTVPESTARRVLKAVTDQGIDNDRVRFLESALNDMMLSRVVSVEDTGQDDRVFDIEVGGDHEYQSGSFLSHNCERSSDIVTASWLDPELAKSNRVQFQCLKSRDQKPFEIFLGRVEWPCRRILTCFDIVMERTTESGGSVDDDLSKIDV